MTRNELVGTPAIVNGSGTTTRREESAEGGGTPGLDGELRRIYAMHDVFDGQDFMALQYLVSRTKITCGADLESAIVRFRDELEWKFPSLDTWRLYARVADFSDQELVLNHAKVYYDETVADCLALPDAGRDRHAAVRYYLVQAYRLVIDLDDAINRGDLGAIRNAADRLSIVLLDT